MAKEQIEESINGFISNFLANSNCSTTNITTDNAGATTPNITTNNKSNEPSTVVTPSTVSASSSTSSERCQKISISSLQSNNAYDDNSSVVDSDSDNEAEPKRAEAVQTKTVSNGTRMISQCEPVEMTGHQSSIGDVMKNLGPLQNISNLVVSDSSHVSVGSRFIFEDGSNITLVVKDKSRHHQPNAYSNNGYTRNGDEELSQRPAAEQPVDDKKNIKEAKRKLLGFHRKYLLLPIALIVLALICATVVLLNLKSTKKDYSLGDGDDLRKNIPIDSTIGNDLLTKGKHTLRHVTRDEWLAQPASEGVTMLDLPATKVIISHSATENCTTQAACLFRTRLIQTFHIESRHWSDIAYNFLIGGDGNVYDGRGWDAQGAHTKGYNVGSIGVSFIGTFNTVVPPERQLNALKQLFQEGINLGKLIKDFKLFGARQLSSTESPGKALFDIIKTWPNFSTDTD